jgi:outer membrane protein assembly factor BamB
MTNTRLRFTALSLALSLLLPLMAQTAPAKLTLPLKQKGFHIYSMELSANGEQLCIAGTDSDDLGASSGRLLLIDRAHGAVLWHKTFAAPDGNAAIYPVQCRIGSDQVYLLAHAVTSNSPPAAQTQTYVYRFDDKNGQMAYQPLRLAARNVYGYALDSNAGTVKVSGYLKDEDDQFEYYATYTATLNATLQPQGEPLVRKSGAYIGFTAARIVGDSTYVTGLFAPAKLSKNDVTEDIAASRLRLGGAYVWSVHPPFGTRSGVHAGVAADGGLYALRYSDRTTSLLAVTAEGKPLPARSYASAYCATSAIASFARGVLAVREACSGKGHALLAIDVANGKETAVNWVPDEPLYVASVGDQWSVVAKDKDGKLALYSGAAH